MALAPPRSSVGEEIMRRILRSFIVLPVGAGLAACAVTDPSASSNTATTEAALDGCLAPTWCPAPSTDWGRDLIATDLHLDVTTHQGHADILFMPSVTSTGASL